MGYAAIGAAGFFILVCIIYQVVQRIKRGPPPEADATFSEAVNKADPLSPVPEKRERRARAKGANEMAAHTKITRTKRTKLAEGQKDPSRP